MQRLLRRRGMRHAAQGGYSMRAKGRRRRGRRRSAGGARHASRGCDVRLRHGLRHGLAQQRAEWANGASSIPNGGSPWRNTPGNTSICARPTRRQRRNGTEDMFGAEVIRTPQPDGSTRIDLDLTGQKIFHLTMSPVLRSLKSAGKNAAQIAATRKSKIIEKFKMGLTGSPVKDTYGVCGSELQATPVRNWRRKSPIASLKITRKGRLRREAFLPRRHPRAWSVSWKI